MRTSTIAILIPCYNESATLPQVIQGFQHALPQATIYVYDNHSNDNSADVAKNCGAIVKTVARRGKGYVVRRMFADIEADYYVIVDGDATYDTHCIHDALQLLQKNNLDMVVCTRMPCDSHAFPSGHTFGNQLFTRIVNFLFKNNFNDIFSGYRVFSRRFVKSFPAISQGFEIETEITIHALQLDIPYAELKSHYRARPLGSESKLNTLKDGFKILRTVLLLFVYIRPMAFFGFVFLLLAAVSLLLGLPIVIDFIHTGLVPKFPTAILAASLMLLASLSLACGIILDSISRSRLEAKKCWYLLASTNAKPL